LLMPLVGLASMAPASAATIVAEYDGEVCHCNALPTEAVSTDTTTWSILARRSAPTTSDIRRCSTCSPTARSR
jgi:hypothetical protein